MTVKELREKAGFGSLTEPDGDREVTGVYIGDLLSWVMGRAQSGDAWITIMSNINVAAVASLADVACVVLAEGVTVEDDVKEVAVSKDINILTSELSAYEIAVRLKELL